MSHSDNLSKSADSKSEPADKENVSSSQVMRKKRIIFRMYQIVWYVLGVMEALLALRIFLKMIGANTGSGFTRFIYALTYPLAAPFFGVIPASNGEHSIIEWSSLLAMLIYLIVAYGLVRLFQFVKPVKASEVSKEIDPI